MIQTDASNLTRCAACGGRWQEDWRVLDLLVNTQEQENAVIPNDLTLGASSSL